MFTLSNDLLLRKIFDSLTIIDLVRLARVSKALNYSVISYMPIRQTFDFSKCEPLIVGSPMDDLQFLIFRSSSIGELNFAGCGKWLSDIFLIPLLQHNRQLRKLSLCNCQSKRMSDSTLLAIAMTCKKLEYLNLDDCCWFSANAFSFLGKNCDSLQTLSLNYCSNIDDASLADVLRNNSHLKALYLRHCRQIGGGILEILSECCKALRILDFSRCSYVSDVTALKLVNGCKYLEDLNLTWTALSPWSLRLLCDIYGKSIRSLSLAATEADDIMLAKVATANEGKLRKVDLSFCHRITDSGLEVFATNCQSLRILNLTACGKVSNKGIQAVGYNCHNLTELTLEDCEFIKSDSLLIIATKCKQLKKLNLNGCWQIKDKPLVVLVTRNIGLQSLSISGCKRVTSLTIRSLAYSCKGITELNISGCIRVDDLGLRHLSLCKEIAFINMDSCSALSARTLATIGSKCRRIQRLSILGCKSINIRSLITVIVNNPELKCIDITNCFPKAPRIFPVLRMFNEHIFVDEGVF